MIDVVQYEDRKEVKINDNERDKTVMYGDVDIHGSVNVMRGDVNVMRGDVNVMRGGTFKIEGIELTSNSISISSLNESMGELFSNTLVTTENDLLMYGNRVINMTNNKSTYFIGENNPYIVNYLNQHGEHTNKKSITEPFDSKLVVFQRQLDMYKSNQPVAAFKVLPEEDDGISKIQLGVMSSTLNIGDKYWDTRSYVNVGCHSSRSKTGLRFDMKPYNGSEQTIFDVYESSSRIHYRFGREICMM